MTDSIVPTADSPAIAAGKARSAGRPRKPVIARVASWTAFLCAASLLGYLATLEAEQSILQSLFVTRALKDVTFDVQAGPSPAIRFPRSGPYDERLGYAGLPSFLPRLMERDFVIEQQARQSPAFRDFMAGGGYGIYHEKSQAGLLLRGRSGETLDLLRMPALAYGGYNEIPPVLIATLRFIEDRDLLDPSRPWRNPAVEWRRFALAAAGRAGSLLRPSLRRGGASTLATQIEKYRHSPDGRTDDITEKMRQMATATARAYLSGPETIAASKEILTTYFDSTPLGSRPGYGEVIGLGDGLLAWYGTDFAETNRLLSRRQADGADAQPRARVYKQALSLLIAQRRPSYYLNAGREDLADLTDAYLRALAAAGVIDPALRDGALALALDFAPAPPAPPVASFVRRKAVDAVRTELMTALDLPDLYSLDRLDLSADASIDGPAQDRVAAILDRLGDPLFVKAQGLVGDKLLGSADPGKVAWSVVVYEQGTGRNLVRVHADSLNQPFDINSGAKLILGSTAKLRTLSTYLGIVEKLHGELWGLSAPALSGMAAATADPLRRWAAEYLAPLPPDARGLQPMLDAALQRRYSASPAEAFFTGGGVQVFHNFERSEDYEAPTVEQAFERSINLAFVRLLREIVRHYQAERALADPDGTVREDYLRRFADQEGRVFINRFAADYADLTPDEALDRLAGHVRPAPRRLAVLFRSVRPAASVPELRRFLARRLPGVSLSEGDDTAGALYAKYDPGKFGLNDRSYLAGVNPLELWLVAYLQDHAGADRRTLIEASAPVRQEAYAWLFKTRNQHKQDVRIRILVEEDAFDRLYQDWKHQGYPFGHLVPSLGTAIGSSGDRPDALAALMGIILNGGMKQPTTDLERLHFAAATPYDTALAYQPRAAERIMAPEVAATLRRALMGVVENGTAIRVRGAYQGADGAPMPIGGKTGTGDNRFETFGPGRQLLESRAVDRTATFVFFLGDHFYGTVTAYVSGADSDRYDFTSALAVALLKALEPALRPLLGQH